MRTTAGLAMSTERTTGSEIFPPGIPSACARGTFPPNIHTSAPTTPNIMRAMDNEGILFLFVYLVLYMPCTVQTYLIVDIFASIILHIGDYVTRRDELYYVELGMAVGRVPYEG